MSRLRGCNDRPDEPERIMPAEGFKYIQALLDFSNA